MDFALELDSVTKKFGAKTAVDELTLQLEKGACLGLLGRNGAGKSTTLKLATGLMNPTAGTVRVLGMDYGRDDLAIKRRIGVMPEDSALLDRLTGTQYLYFVGRMYGLEEAVIARRQAELYEMLDLAPAPGALLCDYSYGMKKKIALSAALIHGPELVFLDEPFEGIDPLTSRTIKDIFLKLRQKGVTLVLTSHILEIVEKNCPLIAILDEGRLRGFGTMDELKARHGAAASLEALFLELMGGAKSGDLSWL
jgi:ABC-2 type transport system ATP-binding protein